MVGLVVTADCDMYQLDYDAPNYGVIKKAVDGWYERVHPVGLERPYCMMVNDDGLLRGLPLNLIDSILYGTPQHGQPIVGDIIFLKDGYCGGEPDVVGMTTDEAQRLGDKFSTMTSGRVRWANN